MRPLFLLPLILLCSCATLPASPPLPEAMAPTPVARGITGDAALSPDGRYLLYRSGSGVLVTDLVDRTTRTIDTPPLDSSINLAWNDDSRHLLVTRTTAGTGVIELREIDGETRGRWEWKGILGKGVFSSTSEIMIPAARLTTYRFGTEVRQVILRVTPGEGTLTEEPLHSATLRPSTYARFQEAIHRGFTITLHPDGDEILYTRVQDPPEFTPYRKVILRHLSSGEELEVGTIPLDAPPPLFSGIDDEILTTDGRTILRTDPWEGKSTPLPEQGGVMAVAPSGARRLIAGSLLLDDATILTTLPPDSQGLFSRDGTVLVVIHDGTAYRILLPPPRNRSVRTDDDIRKILNLRTLRAKRLISPRDFRLLAPRGKP